MASQTPAPDASREQLLAQLAERYRCPGEDASGIPITLPASFVDDARQVMERSQVDALASINITNNISFSVDAFNLTDAMRAEFENDPSLPRRLDYGGRTYLATLRARSLM